MHVLRTDKEHLFSHSSGLESVFHFEFFVTDPIDESPDGTWVVTNGPSSPCMEENLLCTGADGRTATWEAASYGGCHAPQAGQGTHMGQSGASWPLPFPGLLILFAEQLSRETSRQCVSKLTLPEEHSELSLCPWEVISTLRAGSSGRRPVIFLLIHHRIVSTFKRDNEYEGTFKIIKYQFYNESKGIL